MARARQAHSIGWLPPEPCEVDLSDHQYWMPSAVREHFGQASPALHYVVVDELHEGIAGLVISPWPRVDELGRLMFGDEDDSVRLATRAAALLALLGEQRIPIVAVEMDAEDLERLKRRELAIGDVFAAHVLGPPGRPGGGGPGGGSPAEPSELFEGHILDITAEALELAKMQASAALAGLIDEAIMDAIADEQGEGDGPPTSDPEGTPTPSGQGGSGDAKVPEPQTTGEGARTSDASGRQKPSGAAEAQAAQDLDELEQTLRNTAAQPLAEGEDDQGVVAT